MEEEATSSTAILETLTHERAVDKEQHKYKVKYKVACRSENKSFIKCRLWYLRGGGGGMNIFE